jgi:TonB-dependent receptor
MTNSLSRSIRLAGLAGLIGWLAPAHAQSVATASLRGVVVNDATGNFVQGAQLSLVGTTRTAVTDSQGRFHFGALPPGDYRVRTESAGSEAKEFALNVVPGTTVPVTLRLGSEIIAMERLMVTAQAEGQAQALNFQKNSENIRKVASLDALANSRLGEVGEVLQSMPGLYLEISTHQPVRPNIRGLSSEFNSITFDGVRIGNTNNDRSDGVSGYPAESLSRIELMKSVTPDMEGDAIGGSINLVSKRAFDLSERLFKFNLGGAYNHQQQNWDKQLNIEYADRYGPEGRLGVYQSLNHYRSDRGYHTSSISYTVDAADNYNIATYTLQDRIEDDSWKLKYSGSIDYKLSERSIVWVRGIYSNDTRSLEDYLAVYRPGARTNITPNSASSRNGRVDTSRSYREPISRAGQIAGGVENKFDRWNLDAKFSYNRATNQYTQTFTPVFSANGVDLSYDRTVREFPLFRVDNSVNLNDPARYVHTSIARNQHPSRDQEYTFDFNARRELDELPFKASLKTGARAKLRSWVFGGDPALGNWTYTGPQSAAAMSEFYVNDRFFREANGRVVFPSVQPNIAKFLEAFYARNSEYTRNENASAILIESNRKSSTEDIYATYLMGSATFGRLNVVTGARAERTEYSGKARQLTTPRGILTKSTLVENATSYTNVLPGVHLNYGLTPNAVLRFSANRTVARPSPAAMLPTRRIDDEARTITDGNPDLAVTSSDNFDVSAEYYLKPLGVVSVGAFRKSIDGFYFNTAATVVDGEFAGYRLTRQEMGKGGKVSGVEVEWQQRLTFLPGLLSGLGLGANYTWLDSEGKYPTRPADALTFIGTAKRTGNFNVSYVRRGLDLRVFYNTRGDYLSSVGARRALDVFEKERATVDFSAKYRWSKRYSTYLSAKNLTDAPKISFQGNPSNPNAVRYYDFSVNFGVTLDL